MVLNDGIEFQDASQTAVESQLNENKTTNDHEIFKIFHIVPLFWRAALLPRI